MHQKGSKKEYKRKKRDLPVHFPEFALRFQLVLLLLCHVGRIDVEVIIIIVVESQLGLLVPKHPSPFISRLRSASNCHVPLFLTFCRHNNQSGKESEGRAFWEAPSLLRPEYIFVEWG